MKKIKYNSFRSTLIITVFVLLIIISPFALFVFLNSNTSVSAGGDGGLRNPEVWYLNPESPMFITISRFAILSLVVSFGVLGSIISLLSRRDSEEGKIKLISISELFVIMFVGATFAIILMLFFWGGLVSGVLFPRISFSQFMILYDHTELAKLCVWSFIAGFSERLVPQIIENVQNRIKMGIDDN